MLLVYSNVYDVSCMQVRLSDANKGYEGYLFTCVITSLLTYLLKVVTEEDGDDVSLNCETTRLQSCWISG